MPMFGQMLTQKYLTYRLLRFLEGSGCIGSLSVMQGFTFESAQDMLRRKKGFDVSGRTRTRMIKIILDFLCECGLAELKGGRYYWNHMDCGDYRLSRGETERVRAFYGGQVSFFDRCIDYSEEFLRGGDPLFKFDEKSLHVWEGFLGNAEFEAARHMLVKLLYPKMTKTPHLLNLCPGAGFDISAIQQFMPDIEITAVDFTDVFRKRALERAKKPEAVQWIDSRSWNGFGHQLPFQDGTFDLVFFSCADPYIPDGSRASVYRDIFRVIKKGGSLGILTNSYPEPGKKFIKEKWMRCGVLCHDFAESVCDGWNGFSNGESSARLFNETGFKVASVLLNGSLWRLDKE